MARGADKALSDKDAQELSRIADSIRGNFQSVEEMTQTFIREAILQGIFPPGQRLNLDTIAESLGVSRMPVRASLKQLETEGLVRINHHRGASVSVLEPDEIQEIYEIRILLESYLLKLSMAVIDDSTIDRLEEIAHEMEDTADLGKRLELRYQLYEELYRHARRPRALAQVSLLRGSVGRYLLLQRIDEHHSHEDLIALLRARDVESATAWLVIHLRKVSQKLQKLVAGEEKAPA